MAQPKFDITLPRPKQPSAQPPPPRRPFPGPCMKPEPKIINIDINGNQKGVSESIFLSALQQLNDKIIEVETAFTQFSGLQLGEVEGTAYPGEKGQANAAAITLISTMLANKLSRDDLIGYATTENVTTVLDELRQDLTTKIEAVELSGATHTNAVMVSSIVSAMIAEAHGDSDDYSDLLSSIESLNSGF